MEYISVGKILNFHGIKGEAKIGFSNRSFIEKMKIGFIGDIKKELNIETVRFHKNFAIVKFREINSINELIEFKGQNIYIPKENILKSLDRNEFLINDLIGLKVFDNEENYIGDVEEIRKSIANDIICVKTPDKDKDLILIPFVSELVPIVDVKNKKIIIKPIEGLL